MMCIVLTCDDAGQFNVGQHGLCWVHCERLIHKLDAFTDENRTAQASVRGLIWNFYRRRRSPLARRRSPALAPEPFLSAVMPRVAVLVTVV